MAERFLARRLANPAFGATRPTGDAMFTFVRENASKGPCWTGYHRDYSKKEYSDGSCVKSGKGGDPDTKKKKQKRKMRPSKKKEGKESSTDASSSDDDDDDGKKKKSKLAPPFLKGD